MQTNKKAIPLRVTHARYEHPRVKGGGKSRPHSGRGDRPTQLFKAGDTVRATGIYEVIHDRAHRTAHEVVMLSGDSFPPCDNCVELVRFSPDSDSSLYLSG